MNPFKFQPVKIGKYKVIDVKYHRNGVDGVGFYTGLFKVNTRDKSEGGTFVFTMFPSWSGENKDETFDNCKSDYRCAILKLEDLNKGSVEKRSRGDYYYDEVVREAIKEYDRQIQTHYHLPDDTVSEDEN